MYRDEAKRDPPSGCPGIRGRALQPGHQRVYLDVAGGALAAYGPDPARAPGRGRPPAVARRAHPRTGAARGGLPDLQRHEQPVGNGSQRPGSGHRQPSLPAAGPPCGLLDRGERAAAAGGDAVCGRNAGRELPALAAPYGRALVRSPVAQRRTPSVRVPAGVPAALPDPAAAALAVAVAGPADAPPPQLRRDSHTRLPPRRAGHVHRGHGVRGQPRGGSCGGAGAAARRGGNATRGGVGPRGHVGRAWSRRPRRPVGHLPAAHPHAADRARPGLHGRLCLSRAGAAHGCDADAGGGGRHRRPPAGDGGPASEPAHGAGWTGAGGGHLRAGEAGGQEPGAQPRGCAGV